MTTILDPDEKARVRYHMGYPCTSPAPTIALGVPTALQTSFMVENAMNNIMGVSVDRVRSILLVLDKTEAAIDEAQCNLAAAKVGNLELRSATAGETHTDLLEREYVRWAQRLADMLGAPLYPYSARFKGKVSNGASVRNVRVVS
jgi:hypothetical protein